ncbi:MAG: flavodoxin [Porphyromonas sp.]|nr:flavodoxin [Bacteroidales bacterium]MDY3100602.1 flavodoxin [Porphyromonas sp.]
MKNAIVIYGSSTGTCKGIAETIARKIGAEAVDIKNATEETFRDCPTLFLGTSTWGSGEMQDDWYDGVELLKKTGLSGKKVALFGCGDAESYPDTFCGGMRALFDAVTDAGAKVVGHTPTDGYMYDDSEAVIDNMFVGLPLDEDNESGQTEARIDNWLSGIERATA